MQETTRTFHLFARVGAQGPKESSETAGVPEIDICDNCPYLTVIQSIALKYQVFIKAIEKRFDGARKRIVIMAPAMNRVLRLHFKDMAWQRMIHGDPVASQKIGQFFPVERCRKRRVKRQTIHFPNPFSDKTLFHRFTSSKSVYFVL